LLLRHPTEAVLFKHAQDFWLDAKFRQQVTGQTNVMLQADAITESTCSTKASGLGARQIRSHTCVPQRLVVASPHDNAR